MQNQINVPISLNLSEHYVVHWKYIDALRQLFANFYDASITRYPDHKTLKYSISEDKRFIKFQVQNQNRQVKKENYILYDSKDKILILHNQGSFKPERMILGSTSRRQPNQQTIGQFGEGMKLAIIILLRSNMDITFESWQTIYYTTLRSWQLPYDGKVLYIQTRPRQIAQNLRDSTKVTIQNVTAQIFNEFIYIGLALMPANSYEIIKKGESSLIVSNDAKIKSRIFNNNIFVNSYPSDLDQKYQHYSYNLNFELGRDRSSAVNHEEIKKKQSQLHYDICNDYAKLKNDNPALKPVLNRHFQIIYDFLSRNKHQTWYFHNYSKTNKSLCDEFYNKFKKDANKEELYPVQSSQQTANIKDKLKLYGLQESFYQIRHVCWQLYHTLIGSNYYKSIDTKIKQYLNSNNVEELNQQQLAIIGQVKQNLKLSFPQINKYQFKKKNIQNIACFKLPPVPNQPIVHIIYINIHEMRNNKKKFRNSLVQSIKNDPQ